MKLTRFNQLDPVFPSGFNGVLNKFINESFINDVSRRFSPAVDISEDEKAFEIDVALPGMNKSDFNVDLTDSRLTISGERKFEEKNEGKNYHSMETQFGAFSRSFYVPDNILVEKVEASYEDGVLKVILPKAELKVTKAKIEVK